MCLHAPRHIGTLAAVAAIALCASSLGAQQEPQHAAKGGGAASEQFTTPMSAPPPTQPADALAAARSSQRPPERSLRGDDKGSPIERDVPPTRYSYSALAVALSFVTVLGLLFFLQTVYSHRLQQTSYLGGIFRESVLDFEVKRLTVPLEEKWRNSEYQYEALKKNQPPAISDRLRDLDDRFARGELQRLRQRDAQWWDDPWATAATTWNPFPSSLPPGLTPDTSEETKAAKTEHDEYRRLREVYLEERDTWRRFVFDEAQKLYLEDVARARVAAENRTEEAVPATDMAALRGVGPQFVLEFSALIVIIFSAVVLGVLDRLDQQQIGTLLAAIAGYVLGRASTGRSTAVTGASASPVPPVTASSAPDEGTRQGDGTPARQDRSPIARNRPAPRAAAR